MASVSMISESRGQNKARFTSSAFEVVLVFYKIGSFFGVFPYSMEIVDGSIRVNHSKMKMLTSCMGHVVSLTAYVIFVRGKFCSQVFEAGTIFQFIQGTLFTGANLSFCRVCFCKRFVQFYQLMYEIYPTGGSKCGRANYKRQLLVGLIASVLIVNNMSATIRNMGILDFNKSLDSYVNGIEKSLFSSVQMEVPAVMLQLHFISRYAIIIVLSVLYGYSSIIGYFSELLAVFLSLCFYCLSLDFQFATKTERSRELIKIVGYYDELKLLMKEVNSVMGWHVLSIIVEAVPYYSATCLKLVSRECTAICKIETLLYALGFCVLIFPAAEGHRKINEFPEYIFENRNKWVCNPGAEVTFIVGDLANDLNQNGRVGLQGSFFCLISYDFVTKITSAIIAYAIVLFQFNESIKLKYD